MAKRKKRTAITFAAIIATVLIPLLSGCLFGTEQKKADDFLIEPCGDYACDSLAVRAILDSNRLYSVPVDSMDNSNEENSGEQKNRITRIYISGNDFKFLPREIGKLQQLYFLYIANTRISIIPKEIGGLINLEMLSMTSNLFESFPREIGKMRKLRSISLMMNKLMSIPEEIGDLESATTMNLNGNGISTLPKTIGGMKSLEEIYLEQNQLSDIPVEIMDLKYLSRFYVGNNRLCALSPKLIEWIDSKNKFEEWKSTQNCLAK